MELRFSRCSVAPLLLLLLFVAANALRGSDVQVDEQKLPVPSGRGSSRFNTKSAKIIYTSSTPTPTLKTSSRKGSQSRKTNGSNSRTNDERILKSTTLKSASTESKRNLNFESRKTLDKGRTTPATLEEVRTTSQKSVINKKGSARRHLPEGRNAKQGRKIEKVTASPVEPPKDSPKFHKESFRPSSRQVERNPSRKFENAPSGQLEKNRPSVFSGSSSSEISRSRTGRKTQPTYSSRELQSEVPDSKRFASRRSGNVNISRKDIDLKRDSLPSGSENIDVNVGTFVEVTKRSISTSTTSEEPQRQARADNEFRRSSDRGTRSRGRTSSTESSQTEESGNNSGRGNLRRGSSRSSEQSKVTESPELNRRSGVRFSKDEVDMIRPRNPETKSRAENGESKSRGRRPDVRNQSVNTQRTVSQEGPRRSGNKTPDSRTKPPEVKNQDPDSRKRSRIRSRVENTTSKVPDQTTSSPDVVTVVPEVFGTVAQTELNLETTTINLLHSGTLPTTMTSRSATTVAPANRSITKATSRATRRESEGTTRTGERTGAPRRRASKEDFYNHGLGFRGRRPMTDPTTGATITSTPVPAVVSASTTVAPGVQQRGFSGWTLNRRPYPSYSGAESSQVTTAEESTTTSGMTTKPAGRRGNKTFVKTSGDSSLVSKTESLEGENYPADFKAKLAQLKNLANSSQGAIPPPRSPLQGHKKSPSAHFSARSRTKLENALKLVKPELLDEETDSKTTSGPQNEQTIFDHENNRRLENRLSEINSESSLGQESVVKPEWKLKTETNPKNEKRSSKSRVKQGDSFTSRSKTIGEDTENSILESSTEVSRIEKSKVSFKSRNKSQVEINKSEIDNSIRKGKSGSSSREKKIPENVTVTTIKPKRTSPRRSVKNPEEEASKFKPRKPVSRYRNALKNPVQNHLQNTATTEKPRPKSYSLRRLKTYDSITLNPRDEEATMIPTVSNFPAETTITPVTKNYLSVTKSVITKVSEEISTKRLKASAFHDLSKTSESGDRNSKKLNYKSENLNEVPNDDDDSTTIKIVRPTSRYARKKTDLSKTLSPTSKSSLSVLKTANSVSKENQKGTQRREFQPRTATYRRHLELPLGLVRSLTAQPNSIATIPKAERLQAAITSTSRSPLLVRQKPTVSVVSNNSNSSQQQSLGVLNSSNRSSNIFSPTRSVLLTAGNNSLLEQIRSTVAPLLGSLAARSPVFSGVFNNETNVNTAVRITPNGSPPRFSARYKGAELFVRKPSIYQQNIPSITSSSSPFTPVENPSLPPPIEVSNNGEPKIVTFYQALESASITNEQLKTNLEQLGRVAQVDRPTDNDPNGTNSSNNETETITITVITSSSTTDTTMILDTTQSPEATPRALDATQSPENTPTTSESPITSKVTTIYEISPPLTMITPLMEVFELNEVSTTTISATTIEDTTTQSSFSDILTNDIEDSSPETPNVETTTSDDLEAESVVSNTESSSNTQVFTLTPVTMESSSQMSRSETTTTVNEIIFVSDSSVSNETTTESQSESPTTQMTSTESFMTSTEMTTDSVATEARFSTNSVDFPPMMLSTISTMVEASPTRVPSISEEPSTLASLMKTQSTTMSSTAETPSTTVLSIAETPLTAMPTTTDTMSTTLLLSTTETPSMTEMPSTTETSSTTQLPSTTETPSTTLLPSTKSFQLRTTRPTSDPSTIITVTGYPRFPKLQSFLEALAQLRETTTKSQDTTPATAQGTAGANMISSKLVEFSTTPTLMIPTTTPIPTTSMNPTTIPAPKSSTVPDATTMVTQTPEPTTTNNEIERSLISSQQPITTSTATATTTTEPTTTLSTTTSSNTASSTTVPTISNQTTPYLGRFGGSRITPAPRFSSSSSTIAPLRDYLVYGIYPNKTIVRKRPEDNLIDARNIDSPYVIFGIYPDGRLVRKFPNGTVIPDPPSNPVEVVFSLSTTTTTTTTNRPSPSVIVDNQANQGFNNQNAALSNNRSPVATLDSQNGLLNPTDVDNGLSGNSIEPAGPASPVSPTVGSIGSTTQKMVIDAQKATSSVPSATSSSSSNSNVAAGSNGSQQGGRIIQDRERDEATRTREAGGQRSSVYIGQDKFINYWTNDQPNTNPQVLNVKINSVSTAATAGSSSEPKTSFDILPKIGTGAQVTAPPGFPWKDSLEQIFGITTNPPSISASVASNVLDDVNPGNRPIKARPVNSFVEIFSPISTRASAAITAAAIPTSSSTSTTTTTTSTTTSSPPRITIPSGLFTTNMPKQNAFGTTFDDLAFLNTLLNTPKFGGTTPKTLTEVEQLLANKILSLALGKAGPTRSPKAIQPSNASPNLLIDTDPNSESGPVIIDLYPSSTTPKPPATWKPVTSTSPIVVNPWKTILNSIAANQIRISTPNSLDNLSEDLRPVFNQQQTSTSTTTTTPRTITTLRTTTTAKTTTTPRTTTTPSTTTSTSTTTTTIRTTPKSSESTRQVVITAKPRTTTPLPLAIGDNLLSVLFGGNLFGTPTTPPPVINSNPVGTTKSVSTTQRIQTTERVLSNTQFPFLENTNQNLAPLFNHESTSTTTTTPRTTSPSTTTTTTTPKTTTPSTTTTTSTTTPSTTASTTTTTKTTRTTPRSSGSTRQVVITAKPRPRTTTPAPLGFGANLLRALFGGNFFGRQTTTPPPVRTRQPVTTFRRPATITKPVLTTQRILTTERVVSNIQIPSSTQGPIQLTPEVKVSKEKVNANLEAASSTAVGVNDQNSKLTEKQSSTFSPEDDAKFLMALLQAAQEMKGETESSTLVSKTAISKDDDSFLRAILSGQAKDPAGSGKGETGVNNAALLAAFLKAEGIEPPSPANQLREQLLLAGEKNRESRSSTTSEPQTSTTTTRKTTTRPRPAAPTWKPSSTYPPPLFGGFNFGGSSDSFRGNTNSNTGEDNVRSQVVNAAIGVTRAFSQFLGGAIRGAAKQLQTFVGNGTRSFFS
ncbi:mucin-17-like isoform X4 [Belonocnema kinseyi]|uniref:mucin-17-like isoform X4 n=1 Tax=Belonocnema kinseyi TaxID=2817044 RepID=UPI00143DEBDE|nr:mucin-17-like isoform X4 [Belonocnema kinseyi]